MEDSNDATKSSKTVINCEPVLDIKSAATLYSHLKEAVEHKHEVEIDAREVSRIDTSILQIFTAFILEANTLDMCVSWTAVSDNFYSTAKLLGLEDDLKLPSPAA